MLHCPIINEECMSLACAFSDELGRCIIKKALKKYIEGTSRGE